MATALVHPQTYSKFDTETLYNFQNNICEYEGCGAHTYTEDPLCTNHYYAKMAEANKAYLIRSPAKNKIKIDLAKYDKFKDLDDLALSKFFRWYFEDNTLLISKLNFVLMEQEFGQPETACIMRNYMINSFGRWYLKFKDVYDHTWNYLKQFEFVK